MDLVLNLCRLWSWIWCKICCWIWCWIICWILCRLWSWIWCRICCRIGVRSFVGSFVGSGVGSGVGSDVGSVVGSFGGHVVAASIVVAPALLAFAGINTLQFFLNISIASGVDGIFSPSATY